MVPKVVGSRPIIRPIRKYRMIQKGKIPLKDTVKFQRSGFDGHIYIQTDDKAGFNALLIDVHGSHPKKLMVDTTRIYYVVEGEGSFIIDGEVHQVDKDNLFIIPAGHEYEYEGNMKLFEVNISPDNSFKDQKL